MAVKVINVAPIYNFLRLLRKPVPTHLQVLPQRVNKGANFHNWLKVN